MHSCHKCGIEDNENDKIEIVCTDYGFYCWACWEQDLEVCNKCWEIKEQNKSCDYCAMRT